MVPRHEDHPCPLARLAQDLLDDVVVRLVPVPVLPHPPDVEDVADQIQVVGLGVAQEIKQKIGSAPACAEVDVGDPDGPVVSARSRDRVHPTLGAAVSAVPKLRMIDGG